VVSGVSTIIMAESGGLAQKSTSSSSSLSVQLQEEEAMDVMSHSKSTPARSGKRSASSPPPMSQGKKSSRSLAQSKAKEPVQPLEQSRSSQSGSGEVKKACNLCQEPHYGFKCHLHTLNLMPVVSKSDRDHRRSNGVCEHCGVPSSQHLGLCPILRDARLRFQSLRSEGRLPEREPFKKGSRKKKPMGVLPQPPSSVKMNARTYSGMSYQQVVSGFYKEKNKVNLRSESMFKLLVVQDEQEKDFPSLTTQQFEALQRLLFSIFTEQAMSGRQPFQTKDVYYDQEATILCCDVESFNFLRDRISVEPGLKTVSKRELLRLRSKLQYFKGSLGASSMLQELVTRAWLDGAGLPLLRKQLQLEESHLLQFERFEQHQGVRLVVLKLCDETTKRWMSQDLPLIMNVGFKMVVFRHEAEDREELKKCLLDAKNQSGACLLRAGKSLAEQSSVNLLAVSEVRETDAGTAALGLGSSDVAGDADPAIVDGSASTSCLKVEAERKSQADPEALAGGSDPQIV